MKAAKGHGPIEQSYCVETNFYAGEYPGAMDALGARRKMNLFAVSKVTDFIDLTEPGELLSYERYLMPGMTRHSFPIRDQETPRTPVVMDTILTTIESLLAKRRRIYLHCWGGIGRTGTTVACWYARKNCFDGDTALQELLSARRHCPKSKYRESPENEFQRNFVRQYAQWFQEQNRNNN